MNKYDVCMYMYVAFFLENVTCSSQYVSYFLPQQCRSAFCDQGIRGVTHRTHMYTSLGIGYPTFWRIDLVWSSVYMDTHEIFYY